MIIDPKSQREVSIMSEYEKLLQTELKFLKDCYSTISKIKKAIICFYVNFAKLSSIKFWQNSHKNK